jgi:hypothetical protein
LCPPPQRARDDLKFRALRRFECSHGVVHFAEQTGDRHTLFAYHLSPHQVVGLNAGGTLVDGGDSCVAHVLTGSGLLDESDAAVHLNAGGCNVKGVFSAPSFDDRRQEIRHGRTPLTLGRVRMGMRLVHLGGREISQCPHSFDPRFHVHQHAPNVSVLDDRHGRAAGRTDGAALHALACVAQRLLISALGNGHTFQPDVDTGVVHHRKHVSKPAIGFSHQVANGALVLAEGYDRGRPSVNSHFVFNRCADKIIAPAQAAVVVHEELWHDEQRNTLRSRGRVG